jgi:hypothetical protein
MRVVSSGGLAGTRVWDVASPDRACSLFKVFPNCRSQLAQARLPRCDQDARLFAAICNDRDTRTHAHSENKRERER